MDFRAKKMTNDREYYFLITERSIYLTILNVYTPNN